jgi:signal transduction histidine kinase
VVRFEVGPGLHVRRQGERGDALAGPPRVDAMVCRVGDSGPGVEAAQAERIFDPFFTTKPPGEGTGLGLANARRLAQEMGGAVELEAERSPLGGACFRFVLPLSTSSDRSERVRGVESTAQSRMS